MAIKIVRLSPDRYFIKRLLHEKELLNSLNHPNIVKYYGCIYNQVFEHNEHQKSSKDLTYGKTQCEAKIFIELMPFNLEKMYQ